MHITLIMLNYLILWFIYYTWEKKCTNIYLYKNFIFQLIMNNITVIRNNDKSIRKYLLL